MDSKNEGRRAGVLYLLTGLPAAFSFGYLGELWLVLWLLIRGAARESQPAYREAV